MKFVNQVFYRCNMCGTEWHMSAHDIVNKLRPLCPMCGSRQNLLIGKWEFTPFHED